MYVEHIASRALPAAGAWYTGATATTVRGSWRENRGDVARMAVIVTYTRGASGGYPKLRFVWTHALNEAAGTTITAYDTLTSGTITVSGGAHRVDVGMAEPQLLIFSDLAGANSAVVVLEVPPSATALKVECAEIGVVGTPGTIVVYVDGDV